MNIKGYENVGVSGKLTPLEFSEIPFEPVRSFWITGTKAGEHRGGHAHYYTQQFLVCLRGCIGVIMDDGNNIDTTTLITGDFVHIPAMIWDTQFFATEDDILLVFCSTPYDRDDYIEDYSEFLKLIK